MQQNPAWVALGCTLPHGFSGKEGKEGKKTQNNNENKNAPGIYSVNITEKEVRGRVKEKACVCH